MWFLPTKRNGKYIYSNSCLKIQDLNVNSVAKTYVVRTRVVVPVNQKRRDLKNTARSFQSPASQAVSATRQKFS